MVAVSLFLKNINSYKNFDRLESGVEMDGERDLQRRQCIMPLCKYPVYITLQYKNSTRFERSLL